MSDNLLSIQSTCLSFSLKKHNHFCELCVPLPVQRGLVVVLTFSLNLAQEQLPWKPGSWSSKRAEHPHLALTLVGGEAIQHFWKETLVQGQQRNHQLHFSSASRMMGCDAAPLMAPEQRADAFLASVKSFEDILEMQMPSKCYSNEQTSSESWRQPNFPSGLFIKCWCIL